MNVRKLVVIIDGLSAVAYDGGVKTSFFDAGDSEASICPILAGEFGCDPKEVHTVDSYEKLERFLCDRDGGRHKIQTIDVDVEVPYERPEVTFLEAFQFITEHPERAKCLNTGLPYVLDSTMECHFGVDFVMDNRDWSDSGGNAGEDYSLWQKGWDIIVCRSFESERSDHMWYAVSLPPCIVAEVAKHGMA